MSKKEEIPLLIVTLRYLKNLKGQGNVILYYLFLQTCSIVLFLEFMVTLKQNYFSDDCRTLLEEFKQAHQRVCIKRIAFNALQRIAETKKTLVLLSFQLCSEKCKAGSSESNMLTLEWIEKTVTGIVEHSLNNPDLEPIGSLLEHLDQTQVFRLFFNSGMAATFTF